MKKLLTVLMLSVCLTLAPTKQSSAFVWVVVKAALIKIIKAMDLAVQRLQNKTIWLQNAQKTLENTMSKLHLDEISDWVERQRTLYADYFEELRNVKVALLYYQRVKDIIIQQVQLVNEYKNAWTLFRQDKNFTTEELQYFFGVYTGMLAESSKG